jgi:hypothetical protein
MAESTSGLQIKHVNVSPCSENFSLLKPEQICHLSHEIRHSYVLGFPTIISQKIFSSDHVILMMLLHSATRREIEEFGTF